MQVFIKLMVDLDAAELLSQINELGKLFHHMCGPPICTSGLGAPESSNCSHALVLLFSWSVLDALVQGNLSCDSKISWSMGKDY